MERSPSPITVHIGDWCSYRHKCSSRYLRENSITREHSIEPRNETSSRAGPSNTRTPTPSHHLQVAHAPQVASIYSKKLEKCTVIFHKSNPKVVLGTIRTLALSRTTRIFTYPFFLFLYTPTRIQDTSFAARTLTNPQPPRHKLPTLLYSLRNSHRFRLPAVQNSCSKHSESWQQINANLLD